MKQRNPMGWGRFVAWLGGLLLLALPVLSQAANFPGEGTYSDIRTNWSSLAFSSCGSSCAKSYSAANHWITKYSFQQTHWASDNSGPSGPWTITKVGNYYTIKNNAYNKCLAVGDGIYEMTSAAGSLPSSAGYLVMENCTGANQQQWQIYDSSAGGAVGGVEIKTNGSVANYTAHCATQPAWGPPGELYVRNTDCGSWRSVFYLGAYTPPPPPAPNHIRYEFNASTAQAGVSSAIAIKACTTAAGAIGTNPTCTPYANALTLTPGATRGSWAGLTAAPATTFTSASSGITLTDATAESTTLSYTSPSIAPTDPALECYDTSTSQVVSCTNALTFNAPPTVALASPTANQSFASGTTITLNATAADSDGTVSKVDFYQGSTLIGTATASPFSIAWNNVAAGNYSLTAKATDNRNAVTTSSAVAIVVAAPPSVSLTSPTANQAYVAPGTVTLTASASSSSGTISKVDFYQGSTLIGTATDSPYSMTWNNVAAGSYSLTAKATDNRGLVTTSSSVAITVAVNQAPTVSMSATPTSGIAPATITLNATAADADGTVAKVEFYNGATLLATVTQAPYTYSWANVAAGSYSLTAKATDNLGAATTSSAVAVTVANNQAPTVSMSATPTSGIAPATITLNATAADADGTVAKVEFYNGTTLLATVTQAPYTYSWANVAAGSYSLTAKATDNLGAATTSAAVNVTVIINIPPTVSLTTTPATATAPASVILTATAADTDGSIAKVEFFNGAYLLTTLTQAPYAYTWSGIPAGNYNLTAKATDNLGTSTISAPVTLAVASGPTQVYYIHPDHLGTPRVITSQNGNPVWRWESDPFGVTPPNQDPGNSGVPFSFNLRFPGQYADQETNTHYNHFRDYDPTTGRYLESDPIGLKGGINAYAYVAGNPLGYKDPNGLIVIAVPIGEAIAFCVEFPAVCYAGAAATGAAITDAFNKWMESRSNGGSSSGSDASSATRVPSTVKEFCSNCKATMTRTQAQQLAYAWAGMSPGQGAPSPWSNFNPPGGDAFKKGPVWADFRKQYYPPSFGASSSTGSVEEHPFGHPDLPGGQNHDCPHFVARNSAGVQKEFPYAPGSP